MCLIPVCTIGYCDCSLIVLHYYCRAIGDYCKSTSNLLSHTASWVAALTATYSASDVDKAKVVCFFLNQLTGPSAMINKLPVVEWQSSQSPAQSASEYPLLCDFWHLIPRLAAPFRYLKIRLAAVKWASIGVELNLVTTPTACVISRLVEMAACNNNWLVQNWDYLFAQLVNFTLVSTGVGAICDSVIWYLNSMLDIYCIASDASKDIDDCYLVIARLKFPSSNAIVPCPLS